LLAFRALVSGQKDLSPFEKKVRSLLFSLSLSPLAHFLPSALVSARLLSPNSNSNFSASIPLVFLFVFSSLLLISSFQAELDSFFR